MSPLQPPLLFPLGHSLPMAHHMHLNQQNLCFTQQSMDYCYRWTPWILLLGSWSFQFACRSELLGQCIAFGGPGKWQCWLLTYREWISGKQCRCWENLQMTGSLGCCALTAIPIGLFGHSETRWHHWYRSLIVKTHLARFAWLVGSRTLPLIAFVTIY